MYRHSCRAVFAVALAALVAAGCSKTAYDGISDYEREQQAKQAATDAAKSQGLKMTEKTYPLGKAWVVDMKGMTVTDDHFQKLKEAGHVAELDLSKSTVTDAHLAFMRESGVANTLFRLDLSQTAVTDAGFEKLEGLPLLVNLKVTGTKVTPAAVDRYKKVRQGNPQIQPQFQNANVTR